MNCDCGHIMIPICEYHPGDVVFRCISCGKTNNMDYQQYIMSRQSCTCPLCGKKFWGFTIEKCNQCGLRLPRVPKKSWSSIQVGSDDIFIDGWADDHQSGHYYTQEELEASGLLPKFINTYFRSGHTVMLKKWLDTDFDNMARLLDCLSPNNSSIRVKEIVDDFPTEDIFRYIVQSGKPQNDDHTEKSSHVKRNRWWRKKS